MPDPAPGISAAVKVEAIEVCAVVKVSLMVSPYWVCRSC
jgi:hypothetical protein